MRLAPAIVVHRNNLAKENVVKWLFGGLLTLLLLAASAGLAIWGFLEGREAADLEAEREKAMAPAPRVSMQNGEPVVTLDATTQEHGGIETMAIVNVAHPRQLRAYGAVADLQVLTELNNNYATAKSQLNTAQAKRALSKAAFERAQALYKGNPQTISLAQFQAAEATFLVDEASVAAAESQLRALAQTARQLWGPVLARALTDGGAILTRLMEREDVLLQLTLRPGEFVQTPPANAFVQSDSGSRIRIQYASAATKTDARIQGPSFFYTAPADSGLQPGMNVLAYVEGEQTVTGALIPASAVVWLEGRSWIYLQNGPESFARHEIATDSPDRDGGFVVAALPDQSRVVTRGAQTLLSEEFRAQIRVGD